MQKDNRNYTFLFTHSSKSRIYIRRVEVSKRLVNGCASAALFLSLGAGTFAAARVIQKEGPSLAGAAASISSLLEKPNQAAVDSNLLASKVILKDAAKPEEAVPASPASYERPEDANALNPLSTGGPNSYSFKLTNLSDKEESEIEAKLNLIQKISDPSYLPTAWAKDGKINNEFAFRRNPFGGRTYEFHSGIDIDGEKGDPISAPANGTVSEAGWHGGYGNLIEIDHGNGLTTRYGHLSKVEVEKGQTVTRGQRIGQVGSTGRSSGPHLHYELRVNDKAVNPRRFLPNQ